MDKTRILYVASEIAPFLNTSKVADYVRALPEAMQKKGIEIRILVPRFGIINERKNRLHEVVRLSGINISVGEEERPLMIKVASIQAAKMQVYFIDNEDLFHRKSVFKDKKDNYFDDNDERAIFFCKGVIETVKKLGWSPDIIHCNDWMTALLPVYIKNTYKNDPLFKNTKVVFTVYENDFSQKFSQDIISKAKIEDVSETMLEHLQSGDYQGFVRTGAAYADVVVKASEEAAIQLNGALDDVVSDKRVETIAQDENHIESYYNLYSDIIA